MPRAPSRRPPKLPPFLLDEDTSSRRIKDALQAAGHDVRTVPEIFGRQTDDAVWLERAGREGWVVLSKDRRISRKPDEVEALLQARAMVFFFPAGDLSAEELVAVLEANLPKIERKIKKYRPPLACRMREKGALVDLLPVTRRK